MRVLLLIVVLLFVPLGLFQLVDGGVDRTGLPRSNGGLYDNSRDTFRNAASHEAGGCSIAGWPGVDPKWHRQGASEKCFCAYALSDDNSSSLLLDKQCPNWQKYVSTDGATADKIGRSGDSAAVLGNASLVVREHSGSMTDWSVDLGSGYGADCKECVGAHVLSIPRSRYVSSCCDANDKSSLASMLLVRPAREVRELLRDMIEGGLDAVAMTPGLLPDYCRKENEEPTRANGCLAQCIHVRPDVNWLHLHTTVGVSDIRIAPVDSGLGPDFNASEGKEGYYNACVCEPAAWADRGRGHCPVNSNTSDFLDRAAMSLCRNIAAAANLPKDACSDDREHEWATGGVSPRLRRRRRPR